MTPLGRRSMISLSSKYFGNVHKLPAAGSDANYSQTVIWFQGLCSWYPKDHPIIKDVTDLLLNCVCNRCVSPDPCPLHPQLPPAHRSLRIAAAFRISSHWLSRYSFSAFPVDPPVLAETSFSLAYPSQII